MVAVSTTEPGDALPRAVLNVKQVASLLGVSERHVYRMADGGLMPRPQAGRAEPLASGDD